MSKWIDFSLDERKAMIQGVVEARQIDEAAPLYRGLLQEEGDACRHAADDEGERIQVKFADIITTQISLPRRIYFPTQNVKSANISC